MKYLDKPNGLKTRSACVKKLETFFGDSDNPVSLVMVLANSDGTFSPAVLLSRDEMYRARSLSERGIFVMGPIG